MTLEFRPPFSFNPNEETPSQRSLENLTQTIGGLGDVAQRYGQQQHQNSIQDAMLALYKQNAARDQSDWERENRGTLPLQGDQRMGSVDMTPQGTQSWNPSPLDMGRQPFAQSPNYRQPTNPTPSGPSQAPYPQMASAGMPDTGFGPQNTPASAPASFLGPQTPQALHSPGTDLTAHFNAWKQQGGGPYNHPEMSGQMSDPNNPMSQWNQYASIPGSRNRTEYQLFNKNQGEDALHSSESSKNLAEAMKNEAEAGFYKNYKGQSNSLALGQKEDQFYQHEWDKIVHDTDPTQATVRSLLGRAGVGNFQVNRALKTLSNPVVTNQEAGNVMADIAALYQGGSATEFGMSHQAYNTMYGKFQNVVQSITGNPQDSLPDPIKQRLIGVLSDMKNTNQGVIKQKLDLTERAKSKVISRYPDEWKQIRSTLEGDQSDYNGLGGGDHPPQQRLGKDGQTYTYTWNPQTGKYE